MTYEDWLFLALDDLVSTSLSSELESEVEVVSSSESSVAMKSESPESELPSVVTVPF